LAFPKLNKYDGGSESENKTAMEIVLNLTQFSGIYIYWVKFMPFLLSAKL